MITVTFDYKADAVKKVTVSGHGDYADRGEDIVCSGISILTISVLNGLSEIIGICDLDREVRSGYTSFELPEITDPIQKIRVDTLMDTYHLGVCATENAYHEYIKIIENNSGGESND